MVAEANITTDGDRSFCVDYMRARVHVRYAKELRDRMLERFGESEAGPGGYGLPMSDCWMDKAVRLYHDQQHAAAKDFVYFQVTGVGCSLLGTDECIEIARLILDEFGGTFTRADGAVDHEGDYGWLIGRMLQGCQEGELVGAKRYTLREGSEVIPFDHIIDSTKAGGITGHTLYIGARGKGGSGRFVRAYDKGLQTGQAEAGEWVRFELEATSSVANDFMRRIIDGDNADRIRAVYDAVEFREVTQTEDRHLDRRPVCKWWADLVGGADGAQIIRQERQKSTAASHVKWIAETVLPNLYAMAEEMGVSVEGICYMYAREATPGRKAKGGAALLLDELQSGRWPERFTNMYQFLYPQKSRRGAA